MRKYIAHLIIAIVFLSLGFAGGWYFFGSTPGTMRSPFIFEEEQKTYPYNEYSFERLRNRVYNSSEIELEEVIKEEENFTSYVFSYSPLGKKMTGQLNIPNEVTTDTPVIVMIRGYVPHEIFTTGTGTRNGAAAFANAGFITIAPDFFGYGESDPEPEDSWQARFEKPVLVIELIQSIEKNGIPLSDIQKHTTNRIGLWGHSNGGQIALSVLEITKEPYPTSLWAPVTAPFPYSVLFFSDEDQDEGKGMRLWVNQLESDYELANFSVTRFLDGLLGPIQLHHGGADEAALKAWSDEFVVKIEQENDRRAYLKEQYEESATESAKANDPFLQTIDLNYYEYPGADHNLVPNWNTVVERDITFYTEKFNRLTVLDTQINL